MISHIRPENRPSGPTAYDGVVDLSGQTPDDPAADARGQSRQVLATLDTLPAAAAPGKTGFSSSTLRGPDIAHREESNVVWNARTAEPGPARACVEGRRAAPRILVEVAAAMGSGPTP